MHSRSHRLLNLWLVLGSVCSTLLVAEVALRLWRGKLFSTDNVLFTYATEQNKATKVLPVEPDPLLGWRLKPGNHDQNNVWGTKVQIEADGTRANGEKTMKAPVEILALGDSFTFGDEVSNDETWPALLEQRLQKRVINGGVSAYGLDQSLIRARELLEKYPAKLIVLAYIADDIDRATHSEGFGAFKPYFTIESDKLIEHERPSTQLSARKSLRSRLIGMRWLGYSHLYSTLAQRLPDPADTHQDKNRLACLLLGEMKKLASRKKATLWTVALPEKNPIPSRMAMMDRLFDCSKKLGLNSLDLRVVLGGKPGLWKYAHPNVAGNRIIASAIANDSHGVSYK